MARPYLRPAFVVPDRRLKVYFYTSNVSKYLQARAVFEKFGLEILHFKSKTRPYAENYSKGTPHLLEAAVRELRSEVGTNVLFFVEDTSLRIEALSNEEEDFPGLRVKEWFASADFHDFDQRLRRLGNNRAATVKSDIALHVPGIDRVALFHGETTGTIARSPPRFAESIPHPWLTPKTFNGWFVPHGSTKRLGDMSFEESWDYDFRVRAFESLADRLEEFAAILGLAPVAFTRRTSLQPAQLPLLPTGNRLVLVIGPTGAGKTTIGEYLSSRHSKKFIEASSIVRMVKSLEGKSGSTLEFAQELLRREGYDFVARRILSDFGADLESGAVVTGFRTLEEIEAVRKTIPDAAIVLVEASERARYERLIRRARDEVPHNFAAFVELDREQSNFGLLGVARDVADFVVQNEGTIQELYSKVDEVLVRLEVPSRREPDAKAGDRAQLLRCLKALSLHSTPVSVGELARDLRRVGDPIRPNNVNKVLRSHEALAQRVMERGRVKYELTPVGAAYLRVMKGVVDLSRS